MQIRSTRTSRIEQVKIVLRVFCRLLGKFVKGLKVMVCTVQGNGTRPMYEYQYKSLKHFYKKQS